MSNINEYDLVALTDEQAATHKTSLETIQLQRGQIGTVVMLLAPEACLVDFADGQGNTYAMETIPTAQLLLLHQEPIAIKAAILKQIIPPLQRIQNFHDGLPSAVYASRLLRSFQALSHEFADSAYGQVLQTLDQSLSRNQQWGCYTVEYYQTVAQLLSELIDRPHIRASDVQAAISTIEQISQTMTHSGIVTDQELED